MVKAENAVSFTVGRKINYYRRVQGVSLQYLADMVNISTQQLRLYENGDSKIKVDKLYDISLALGIPFSVLACEDEF
jgi:transcriptional regulator with XRE-family HTH domain